MIGAHEIATGSALDAVAALYKLERDDGEGDAEFRLRIVREITCQSLKTTLTASDVIYTALAGFRH